MPSRRQFLGAAGASALAATAGCSLLDDRNELRSDYPGVAFEDGWRSFGHDHANTRFARDATPLSDPETASVVERPPSWTGTTSTDDRVFVSDDEWVHAFDTASRERVWRAETRTRFPPTVIDGVAYTAAGSELRGFDVDSGDLVAQVEFPAQVVTPPAVSVDSQRFVVALADGRVAGVGRYDGDVWTRSVWGNIVSMPSVHRSVTAVATATGEVYVFRTDGTPVWRTNLGARDLQSPVVGDERVYVNGHYGTLAALSRRTGEVVWERDEGAGWRALAFDGPRLYSGTGALDAHSVETGEVVWSYGPEDANVRCAPAVAGDTVFVGRDDGVLAALDRESGDEKWTLPLGGYLGPSVTATDGLVVATGQNDEGSRTTFVVQS
ncbi:outer membrane protein assembly factor BamB family protein [Salarchaeum japonicum]|uniref:Pyrrolo-quinoline quinone repeat domain-containing protein n=1 Tax=Salarchaeum japonicum TaxID=555573 RepID=A0AAV3SZD0_9EURY|nr:PQQ-binding-like beta-propeller repeat protein [Salarchaeum japonicum]